MGLSTFRSFAVWVRQPHIINIVALACAPLLVLSLLIPRSFAAGSSGDPEIAIAFVIWSYASTALLIPAVNWAKRRKMTIQGPIRYPVYLAYGAGTGVLVGAVALALFMLVFPLAAIHDVRVLSVTAEALFNREWLGVLEGAAIGALVSSIVFLSIVDLAGKA